ncbi:Kelch-like protein diablo [Seminavis robusta]|uniref:Kelch-like protein diablo n=1 Tax=Seminavis robusta TaxID=568900 RepID=A0A9N8DA13_9STRA|nr:Kelch-like protein diablo [Seminavis robusta]|eukprot:Sro54_g032020.1 Kelch-like protein diablo (419) ;mRNA; f:111505-112844
MNNSSAKEISRDEMLASFLTDEALNDVTLKGNDGVEVFANRFLLSARSPVFRAMFLGKFREASSPVVEIDFRGCVLQAVVEYIYTDRAGMTSCKKRKNEDGQVFDSQRIQSLVSLAAAASFFELSGLGESVLKKFEHIWGMYPLSSFEIFQACRMAGPSIPTAMLGKARTRVRRTPADCITKDRIHCLSPDVLEEILKDPEMQMSECQLFRILSLWAQGTLQGEDRKGIAKDLSKHIRFEKMDPQILSTTITASGLVASEQLLEAYKHQALEARTKSKPPTFSASRGIPETTTWAVQPRLSSGNPVEILVQGAGSEAVNGIFVRDGTFNGHCRYIKPGTYGEASCLFWLYRWNSGRKEFWVISIIAVGEMPGSCPREEKDFYKMEGYGSDPPSSGWEKADPKYGVEPSPNLLSRYYKK